MNTSRLAARLRDLGFSVTDVIKLEAALDEGFTEDCMPILRRYPQILAQFAGVTGMLYRAQLLTADDVVRRGKGRPLSFDTPVKTFSRSLNTATSFSEPFGEFVTAIILQANADMMRTIDVGRMFGGRWADNQEVWVFVQGAEETLAAVSRDAAC